MSSALNRAKLRWRCRRGTKELDYMLSGFFDRRFDELDASGQEAFAWLLEQQDPLVIDWIWGTLSPPQGALNDIIEMIRRDSGIS